MNDTILQELRVRVCISDFSPRRPTIEYISRVKTARRSPNSPLTRVVIIDAMRSKKTDSLITGLGGEKKILENHERLEKYLLYQLVTDDIQQREENFRSATDEIRDAMLATERSPRHRILIWRVSTQTLNHLTQELPPDLYTYPFWGPTQTWRAAGWLTGDRFYR